MALPILLLLLAPADTEVQIVPTSITDAFPADGVEIPTNARPILFGLFTTDAGLVRPTTGTPVSSFGIGMNALQVDPGALTPRSTFDLVATCSGCSFARAWPVGDDDDIVRPELGSATLEPAASLVGVGSRSDRFRLDIIVSPVSDASGVLLEVDAGVDGVTMFVATGSGATAVSVGLSSEPDGGGVRCAAVTALDVALNRSPFPEEACVDLGDIERPARGCGAVPHREGNAAPTSLLGLLVFLGLARRRASSCRTA